MIGEDIVCRYGGEEFLLVLPRAKLKQSKDGPCHPTTRHWVWRSTRPTASSGRRSCTWPICALPCQAGVAIVDDINAIT
ncbi:hypothetical protein HIO72_14030 [Halomonas sp. PA5]|nr:hypothetical protein HIO72_14030 [Halomonas sp. PA5]